MAELEARIGEKIILMGLDNSGKTSILLSLKGDQNLLTYFSLKPTPGVHVSEVTSLNNTYYVWDLGGQASYRQHYLEDLPKYLGEATRIIFVIDIQDKARMDQALGYFQKIIDAWKAGKYDIKLSVYFHKYDPAISEDASYVKYTEEIVAKLKKIIPQGIKYQIFKTTIYTVFRKTIIS